MYTNMCCCCCLLLSSVWLFATPMDFSSPGSSAHGISQARILEWVAVSFSRGSSRPRNWTCISCIAGGFFTTVKPLWRSTREAHTNLYTCTYIHVHITKERKQSSWVTLEQFKHHWNKILFTTVFWCFYCQWIYPLLKSSRFAAGWGDISTFGAQVKSWKDSENRWTRESESILPANDEMGDSCIIHTISKDTLHILQHCMNTFLSSFCLLSLTELPWIFIEL